MLNKKIKVFFFLIDCLLCVLRIWSIQGYGWCKIRVKEKLKPFDYIVKYMLTNNAERTRFTSSLGVFY